MILRDYWFCWVRIISTGLPASLTCIQQILSVAFELAEYSLEHQLPNFAEVCYRRTVQFANSPIFSAGGTM